MKAVVMLIWGVERLLIYLSIPPIISIIQVDMYRLSLSIHPIISIRSIYNQR